MFHLLKIGVPLVLLATLASPVQAEQGGKWRGRAVLVTTQTMQAKVADTTDHAVEVGVQEGVVFTKEGGDFLANAHYQVVYLNDSAGMVNGGYKTFTVADDSKVFAQFTIRESNPTRILGDWKFLNGTGKYQGVTGNGTFEVGIVADRVMWDVLQGEYKLP